MSPRPSQEVRSALFAGDVPDLLKPYSKTTANYSAVTKGRAELFNRRLDQLERLAETGRLLDVGASSGVLVKLARERGWDAFGVEPSVHGAAEALKEGLPVPRAYAESLPFASESFDVVHSHHVFEHLADPLAAAKEAHRALKPGGLIFVEVPNQLANIMFRRDMLLRRVPRRDRNIRSIHHLWFFSRQTLPALLRRAGFERVRVEDAYYWGPQGLRAPLTYLTQLAGRACFGGPLVRAFGYKGKD
jgi:SAM-dependent methyltransferase